MGLGTVLMLIAVACFVLEAFDVGLGSFHPKWWALGVAFYLAAQVA